MKTNNRYLYLIALIAAMSGHPENAALRHTL